MTVRVKIVLKVFYIRLAGLFVVNGPRAPCHYVDVLVVKELLVRLLGIEQKLIEGSVERRCRSFLEL